MATQRVLHCDNAIREEPLVLLLGSVTTNKRVLRVSF